jgi:hypothetical protein
MNGIGKIGMNQNRDAVSLWRIYMPSDVDREEYIKTCFLTGTVTVINENGEIIHRVKIGKFDIQQVRFPMDLKSFGSEVICLSAPYSGKLYITNVYNSSNEFSDQQEDQYRLYKSTDNGFAELRIDGQGKIHLSVDSEGDSDITISVANKERTGKLNVNVNGDILIQNDGTTTLKSTNKVLIDSPKIYLNDSEEPILLGQKTVDLLSDLLDQLNIESAGPYPLLGNSKYATIKQGLEDLKSKLSFVK